MTDQKQEERVMAKQESEETPVGQAAYRGEPRLVHPHPASESCPGTRSKGS